MRRFRELEERLLREGVRRYETLCSDAARHWSNVRVTDQPPSAGINRHVVGGESPLQERK